MKPANTSAELAERLTSPAPFSYRDWLHDRCREAVHRIRENIAAQQARGYRKPASTSDELAERIR
jgi:hypothetical protein